MKLNHYLIQRTWLWLLLLVTTMASHAQEWEWKNVTLEGMGYVTGIVAHPTVKDVVYARTDAGGLFRWNANTNSWIPLNDGKGTGYAISSVALDPDNANLVYAAIGHKENGAIYKSTNKGASWTKLGLTGVYMEANGKWRQSGERLSVSGNLMYYASRRNGLWKSTNGGQNWNMIADTKVPKGSIVENSGQAEAGQTFALLHPKNKETVYVGVQGYGIYRSTDGGKNWNRLSGGPNTINTPVHATISNNGTLFVTYGTGTQGNNPGPVYKALENGNLNEVTPNNRRPKGFAGISVRPSDDQQVLTFQWGFGDGIEKPGIHRSTNGGDSWAGLKFRKGIEVTEPAYYPSFSPYTNAGQILWDPLNENRAWLTSGFAVYRSDNIKSSNPTWKTVMEGLEEIVCVDIKAPPSKSGNILLGTADMVGFSLDDTNKVPSSKLFPDRFGIAPHFAFSANNPDVMAFVGSEQYDYADLLEGFTGISRDGGSTWQPFENIPEKMQNGNIAISSTNSNNMVWAPMSRSNLGMPIGNFDIDVHYTTDGGKTWKVSSGTPKDVRALQQYWFGSEVLVADPVNGNKFYLYDRGNLLVSNDKGANFAKVGEIRNNGEKVDHWEALLRTVPGVANRLFFVRKDGGPLFNSSNGGKDWGKVAGVSQCILLCLGKKAPGQSNPTLYIYGKVNGTEGMYLSKDYGANWEKISTAGLPIGKLNALDASKTEYGKLYLGSNGRGAWVGTLKNTTPPDTGDNLLENGDFSQGTTAWKFWTNKNTASATRSVSNGQMKVAIEQGGTGRGHVQLYQPISIKKDQRYEVSFRARASANRSIQLRVFKNTPEYGNRIFLKQVDLTTSIKAFGPFYFTGDATTSDRRADFYLGASNADVTIDDVVIRPVEGDRPEEGDNIVKNHTFDNAKDHWNFWANASTGASGSWVVTSNKESRVIIDNGGTAMAHVQLLQKGIALVKDQKYRVSYRARANGNRTIRARIQKNTSRFKEFYAKNQAITTTMKTYDSFTFTSEATTSDRRIVFLVGGSTGRVWIDDVSIVPIGGDSAPDPGTAKKYEAENAQLTGTDVRTSYDGYTGSGYVDGLDADGDKIRFTVNVASAGSYPLTIRYNVCGEQKNDVAVNGSSTERTFPDNITGCGGWEDLTFNITLNAGNNTVEIRKKWGYTAIDYIIVGERSGTSLTADIETGTESSMPFRAFPNPVSTSLSVAGAPKGTTALELYDLLGRRVARVEAKDGELQSIQVATMPPGTYLLRATDKNNGTLTATKIVVE